MAARVLCALAVKFNFKGEDDGVTRNGGGAFALTNAKIDEVITKTSAGNYSLGYTKDGTFYVKYVGRSDSCVRSRLKQHVEKHPQFKFCYAGSPKAAFEKECTNFHDFGGTSKLENDIHPASVKLVVRYSKQLVSSSLDLQPSLLVG